MRTTFHYPESPYGRTYADVITKISRMDSLPNYLSYGASLARGSRAQGAPLQRNTLSNNQQLRDIRSHQERRDQRQWCAMPWGVPLW